MKDKKRLLAALGLLLPLTAGTGSALAYFTDHVMAESAGYPVEVGGPDTELEEEVDNLTKKVRVENTGEIPVYVRIRVFCGSEYDLEFGGEDDWKKSGEYYYYTGNGGVLEVGEKTPQLLVSILGKDGKEPRPGEGREEFNVVVICERLPLQYDAEGNVLSADRADWTAYKAEERKEGEEKG